MAYRNTPSHKISIDDEGIYAEAILTAREQGKTLGEFAKGALSDAIHVHNRQKHYHGPREGKPAPNVTSPPAALRPPPKPR